jgi:hypothetical protein
MASQKSTTTATTPTQTAPPIPTTSSANESSMLLTTQFGSRSTADESAWPSRLPTGIKSQKVKKLQSHIADCAVQPKTLHVDPAAGLAANQRRAQRIHFSRREFTITPSILPFLFLPNNLRYYFSLENYLSRLSTVNMARLCLPSGTRFIMRRAILNTPKNWSNDEKTSKNRSNYFITRPPRQAYYV